MKITEVNTYFVRPRWGFVEVKTDDGFVGWAEAVLEGHAGAVILKEAVDLGVTKINSEYLLKGYDYAESEGLNKSLFKVRILKNIFGCTKEEVYSFFMGTILCDEILNIIKDDTNTVVLGGKSQIKKAMTTILREKSEKNVIELDEKTVDYSTSFGLIKIYEHNTL